MLAATHNRGSGRDGLHCPLLHHGSRLVQFGWVLPFRHAVDGAYPSNYCTLDATSPSSSLTRPILGIGTISTSSPAQIGLATYMMRSLGSWGARAFTRARPARTCSSYATLISLTTTLPPPSKILGPPVSQLGSLSCRNREARAA